MAKSIEDIAADVDESTTTVRLVLLGKARQYRINPQVEQKIQEYTERYGAEIRQFGRPRFKRSDSLALIVPRLSNHFFAELAEKMEIRCRDAGLQLSISCCYDDAATQLELIEHYRQRNVDGLFLVPANSSIPPKASVAFPDRLVLLDRDFGFSQLPTVVTDNYSTSFALTEKLFHFAQKKHHMGKFLFIAGNPRMPSVGARLDAFKHALQQLNADAKNIEVIQVEKNQFAEGVKAMDYYLANENNLPQVLVTSSIPLLQGAMQALKNSPKGIPETLILATFDDHCLLDFIHNPICSVRQDYQTLIDTAFEEMNKLLSGKLNPLHHTAKMAIIERNMVV
ncbi:MAG: substrate-binding domain-containing protein [Cellvibrio sp.]